MKVLVTLKFNEKCQPVLSPNVPPWILKKARPGFKKTLDNR